MRLQKPYFFHYITIVVAILIPLSESWRNPIDYPSNSPWIYNPWTNIPLFEESRPILQQIQGVIRNFWQFPSSTNRNFQSFSNVPSQSNWNQQQPFRNLNNRNPTIFRPPYPQQQPRQRSLYACDKLYEPNYKFVTSEIRRKLQNCCYSFPRSTFACNNGTSICWGNNDNDNLPKCCGHGCGESPSPENIVYHPDDLKVVKRNESECDGLAKETDEDLENVRKCCNSFPHILFGSCSQVYQSEHCNVVWGPCCLGCGGAGAPVQKSTPRPINLDLDYYD